MLASLASDHATHTHATHIPPSGQLLIVDDERPFLEMLTLLLERDGYTVTTAEDGERALAQISERAFDLILLDVIMPGLDGLQVLERLKSDARWRGIPVIMLSTVGDMDRVVRCIEMGADDYLTKPTDPVLVRARIKASLEKKRLRDREIAYVLDIERERMRSEKLLNVVIPIGMALMNERDFNRLLEMMLLEAKRLCNADGGTLYLRTDDDTLKWVMVHNDSLHLALGGTSGKPIPFQPLRLYDASGKPNHANVATHVALTGASINFPDAYQAEGFDFSGTRAFDQNTGYRSKSFLTIPLKGNTGRVIGVLQLINAQDPDTGDIIAFDAYLQQMIESLSSVAAVALEVYLREKQLRQQIEQLQIEIDEVRKARQVAEITETDYFRTLRQKARQMRSGASGRTASRPTADSE